MNEKVWFQITFYHEKSFSVEFEFETRGYKRITTSLNWKLAEIS